MDTVWDGTSIVIKGQRIGLLGDPHLGRRFVNDVPLHRRGQREQMVMRDFEQRLVRDQPMLHVCMGDLFDKPVVDPAVVLAAARIYLRAASESKNTTFVVIAGNHDLGRDVKATTSFDLFAAIVDDAVVVVRDQPMVLNFDGLRVGFCPWSATMTAEEMARKLSLPLDCAFGHWDVIAPGEDRSNLAPVDVLREMVSVAVTGHDHRCRVEKRGDFDLMVTGSMQPYAHGEDPGSRFYMTMSLDEFRAQNLGLLRDKCLRIVLQDGEDAPTDIDALQVKFIRPKDQEAQIAVGFDGGLNMQKLFADTFSEFQVPPDLADRIMERYRSC